MKKLFVLILTIVAAITLVGCGGGTTGGNTDGVVADNSYTVETVE